MFGAGDRTYLGHGVEPQFAMNIALATLALEHGQLFPPGDTTGVEKPSRAGLRASSSPASATGAATHGARRTRKLSW